MPTPTSTSGVAIEGAEERDGALQLRTSAGPLALDFLIFATGFSVDWRQRPMLRHVAPHIRLWKDRYRPPPDADDAELAGSPDLGAAFEFQPRAGAHCPGLERLHCFCYPATLSLGVITGDIPAISEGALQLADRLTGLLYVEDIEHHFSAHRGLFRARGLRRRMGRRAAAARTLTDPSIASP